MKQSARAARTVPPSERRRRQEGERRRGCDCECGDAQPCSAVVGCSGEGSSGRCGSSARCCSQSASATTTPCRHGSGRCGEGKKKERSRRRYPEPHVFFGFLQRGDSTPFGGGQRCRYRMKEPRRLADDGECEKPLAAELVLAISPCAANSGLRGLSISPRRAAQRTAESRVLLRYGFPLRVDTTSNGRNDHAIAGPTAASAAPSARTPVLFAAHCRWGTRLATSSSRRNPRWQRNTTHHPPQACYPADRALLLLLLLLAMLVFAAARSGRGW